MSDDILLQAHTGTNLATRREVDLGQDRIFYRGDVVGYVCRKPDAPINLIVRDLPQAVKDAIAEAVKAKFGGEADRMSEPIEIPDDTDSDEEDLE